MPVLADGENYDAARVAAIIGLHLVTQVLDEACTIAQASQKIGWPWTCGQIFRDSKDDEVLFPVPSSDKTFVVSHEDLKNSEGDMDGYQGDIKEYQGDILEEYQGDIKGYQGDIEDSHGDSEVSHGDNEVSVDYKDEDITVTTSTPHKGESPKMKAENSFIGQGDEEFDNEELTNSTSMFISHLFDMSEVEQQISREETEVTKTESQTEVNAAVVTNLMHSLFDSVLNIATDQIVEIIDLTSGQLEVIEVVEIDEKDKLEGPGESSYSFLADSYDIVNDKDVGFYIEDDAPSNKGEEEEEYEETPIVIEEPPEENEEIETTKKCDVARYEDAYLTLNRDYEVCSDGDGDRVLQDPKGLVMQEVELITASTSEDNVSTHRESEEERKKLAATSAVSGVSGSKKSRSSLVSRCRSQGARLLACLRGWWRRKTPGKRKTRRPPGSIRGMCPLSPDARRRAASLLDQRELYSPSTSTSHTVAWKFNTINDALVKSSNWKDYAFEGPSVFEQD